MLIIFTGKANLPRTPCDSISPSISPSSALASYRLVQCSIRYFQEQNVSNQQLRRAVLQLCSQDVSLGQTRIRRTLPNISLVGSSKWTTAYLLLLLFRNVNHPTVVTLLLPCCILKHALLADIEILNTMQRYSLRPRSGCRKNRSEPSKEFQPIEEVQGRLLHNRNITSLHAAAPPQAMASKSS